MAKFEIALSNARNIDDYDVSKIQLKYITIEDAYSFGEVEDIML